jgi:hypothetical protein
MESNRIESSCRRGVGGVAHLGDRGAVFIWTKVEVQQYGYVRTLTPGIIEVDKELVREYPKIAA